MKLLKVSSLLVLFCLLSTLNPGKTLAVSSTQLPLSVELATSLAEQSFPLTINLDSGKLFLTEPVVLFMDADNIGLRVRLQAYDHRPAEGIATSEMGLAIISATPGYDPVARRILLQQPKLVELKFDRENPASKSFDQAARELWNTQAENTVRARLPQHPYIAPFRSYISDVSYDGKNILLKLQYN